MQDIQKKINQKEAQKRKKNMKTYPYYIMVGYDLMFYYSIYVLFLSQVKHVSDANIVLLSSIYALGTIIFILPASAIVTKIGTRKAIMISDLLSMISTSCYIVGNTYILFVIGQLISSIAFALKNTSVSPFLQETIPETDKRSEIFSRIDSSGYSKYCIFSAVSTILSGYLYNIDPYIPMFLCMLISIISFIIASHFEQIEKTKKEKTLKQNLKELKEVIKFTLKTQRLKSLLLSLGLIWGVLTTFTMYSQTLLKNLEVPAQYIGIILALLEVLKGLFSKRAELFNKKNQNTSLTKILYTMALCFVIIGIISIINIPWAMKIAIIILLFIIIRGMNGIYQIICKRYINNFMNVKVLPSIYSMQSLFDNISRVVITLIASRILNFMNIQYATVLMGVIFVILTSIVSGYMRTRVGLEPEEYSEKEMKYLEK